LSGPCATHARPPWTPGARPDVDDQSAAAIVSSSCSTTGSCSQVAQVEQGVDQAGVVALVQADRGLVEDVQHAHQARADLRRQPDALCLAARQRRRRPVEGQVVEADVEQEPDRVLISLTICRAIDSSRSDSCTPAKKRAAARWTLPSGPRC
jgi:hypothetical protein